jgi:sec-independent protein translocase protein TatA
MGLSFAHILIVLLVIVLLFGRGKISEVMGDVAKGIKSFKKGLSDDDEQPAPSQPAKQIELEGEKATGASREERKVS